MIFRVIETELMPRLVWGYTEALVRAPVVARFSKTELALPKLSARFVRSG